MLVQCGRATPRATMAFHIAPNSCRQSMPQCMHARMLPTNASCKARDALLCKHLPCTLAALPGQQGLIPRTWARACAQLQAPEAEP